MKASDEDAIQAQDRVQRLKDELSAAHKTLEAIQAECPHGTVYETYIRDCCGDGGYRDVIRCACCGKIDPDDDPIYRSKVVVVPSENKPPKRRMLTDDEAKQLLERKCYPI